jgi:hypothetical protein
MYCLTPGATSRKMCQCDGADVRTRSCVMGDSSSETVLKGRVPGEEQQRLCHASGLPGQQALEGN